MEVYLYSIGKRYPSREIWSKMGIISQNRNPEVVALFCKGIGAGIIYHTLIVLSVKLISPRLRSISGARLSRDPPRPYSLDDCMEDSWRPACIHFNSPCSLKSNGVLYVIFLLY